jgi:hypothetical protein
VTAPLPPGAVVDGMQAVLARHGVLGRESEVRADVTAALEAAAPAIRKAAVNDERGRLQGHLADAHARAAGLEALARDMLSRINWDDYASVSQAQYDQWEATLEGKS